MTRMGIVIQTVAQKTRAANACFSPSNTHLLTCFPEPVCYSVCSNRPHVTDRLPAADITGVAMFLSSLMAIAAVLIMGVISPGPSFILSRAMPSLARVCTVW